MKYKSPFRHSWWQPHRHSPRVSLSLSLSQRRLSLASRVTFPRKCSKHRSEGPAISVQNCGVCFEHPGSNDFYSWCVFSTVPRIFHQNFSLQNSSNSSNSFVLIDCELTRQVGQSRDLGRRERGGLPSSGVRGGKGPLWQALSEPLNRKHNATERSESGSPRTIYKPEHRSWS